jgi:periplasmic divalent cation tolerance protein
MDNVVVLTTLDSTEAATRLAHQIVEERLAACVQAMPIQSVYRWNGAVQEEAEVLLMIKTRGELFAPLEAFINARHSYETPEIVALPIVAGSQAYQDWIATETS